MDGHKYLEATKARYELIYVKMEPESVYTEDVMHKDLTIKAIPGWKDGKIPPDGVKFNFYHEATPVEYSDEPGYPKEQTFEVGYIYDTYIEVKYNGKTETSDLLFWEDKP